MHNFERIADLVIIDGNVLRTKKYFEDYNVLYLYFENALNIHIICLYAFNKKMRNT